MVYTTSMRKIRFLTSGFKGIPWSHGIPHFVAQFFQQTWKSLSENESVDPLLFFPELDDLVAVGFFRKDMSLESIVEPPMKVHRKSLSYGKIGRIIPDFRSSRNPGRVVTHFYY